MSQQTIKQRARQKALGVAARQRRERAEREKRLGDLAVVVLTAVAERDEFIEVAERRAGDALRDMTEREGLTLRDAVAWCGEEISVREATRLRQIAGEESGASSSTEPSAQAGKAAESGKATPARGATETPASQPAAPASVAESGAVGAGTSAG